MAENDQIECKVDIRNVELKILSYTMNEVLYKKVTFVMNIGMETFLISIFSFRYKNGWIQVRYDTTLNKQTLICSP